MILSAITLVTPSGNLAVFESDNTCYALGKRHDLRVRQRLLHRREVSRFGSVITLATQSKNITVFESDNACYTVGKRHGLEV